MMGATHVGEWTPFVTEVIGTSSTVLPGHISLHSSRDTSPCLRLTPFVERSEEHTSELQSRQYLVCRLLLEKKEHSTQKRRRQDRVGIQSSEPRDRSTAAVITRRPCGCCSRGAASEPWYHIALATLGGIVSG